MQKVLYIFLLLIGCLAVQAQFCSYSNSLPFLQWEWDNRQFGDTLTPVASSYRTTKVSVGIIVPYTGEIAPEGWLFCDGKSLSISDYPELYHVIGGTYGGSEECFCVPDITGLISKPSHMYYTPAEANTPNKNNEKREVHYIKVNYIIKY